MVTPTIPIKPIMSMYRETNPNDFLPASGSGPITPKILISFSSVFSITNLYVPDTVMLNRPSKTSSLIISDSISLSNGSNIFAMIPFLKSII